MRSQPFSPKRNKKFEFADSPTLTKRKSIKQILSRQSQTKQILNQYNREHNNHLSQNKNKNNTSSISDPNKIKTPKKQQFIVIQSPMVNVQPKHYLQFLCTQFQTSATLKMFINQNASPFSVYKFNIRSTNRQDYIVTEPSGQLKLNQMKVIYFYLKQNASINKNLKDKFLLEIFEERQTGLNPPGKPKTVQRIKIYAKKFPILIQCAINKKQQQPNVLSNLNASTMNNNNMSKYLSIYMTPQIQSTNQQFQRAYVSKTELRNSSMNSGGNSIADKLSPKSRDQYEKRLFKASHLSPVSPLQFTDEQRQYKDAINTSSKNMDVSRQSQKMKSNADNNQDKTPKFSSSQIMGASNLMAYDPQRLENLRAIEQDMKTVLNQTIQDIQKKKRRKMILENQNKSTKARARFRIYLTIIMVISAFFFGMFVKSLGIKQGITNIWERTERRFQKYWASADHQATIDKTSNSKQTIVINEGPVLNQYTQKTL